MYQSILLSYFILFLFNKFSGKKLNKKNLKEPSRMVSTEMELS